jgi:hypothetical protein
LIVAAKIYAACLARAGQDLISAEPLSAPEATGGGPEFDPPLPSTARTIDLTADEGLVLQGVRIWVACAKEDRCGGPALSSHLCAHGAGSATPSLHGILYNSSVTAMRPIDVRCRRCPNLSPDEARMIHAIACGQRRLRVQAAKLLCSWMPAAAVRLTVDAVLGAGAELAAAHVLLPWRNWDFAELEQRSVRPDEIGHETRVLH